MPTVEVQINAPGDPVYKFVNADSSGWMTDWNWKSWKEWMSGDHEDRERGRRHQPAYNAYAAALITQSTLPDAESVANKVYDQALRDWKRKENFWGRLHYQWRKHLAIQHLGGTIALNFIPVIGPVLSGLAAGCTPMIEAAATNAIAEREGGRVAKRFREDYYKAMDSWLNGESDDLPIEFLEYHAKVVLTAARDVREQIRHGEVNTGAGVYPLTISGLSVWREQHQPYKLEDLGGFFSSITTFKSEFVYAIHHDPTKVAMAVGVGTLSGLALFLALRMAS